jgi:hypothetical protein
VTEAELFNAKEMPQTAVREKGPYQHASQSEEWQLESSLGAKGAWLIEVKISL